MHVTAEVLELDKSRTEKPPDPEGTPAVRLRRLPYPYKSMLAICSDLDETPDRHVYWEIARFLNTTEMTAMGLGVGLEVGNSIYFDMAPDQFAYWNTDDAGREMVRALIHSGHIDCLHSYGDLATTRANAGRALDELDRQNCTLEVWVDHSKAITNFGADIMCGHGDEPGHPAYHADLTCDYGIRYVSRGRVTSVIGQDVPASLAGIFTAGHPIASATRLAKETAKQVLSHRQYRKYQMHRPNKVIRQNELRDGRPILEFIRGDGYWGGFDESAGTVGIADAMPRRFLNRLVEREGVCVFYTHLGKIRDRSSPFPAATRSAFNNLANDSRNERILVTTTHRLLRYLAVRDSLRCSVASRGRRIVITVDSIGDAVGNPRAPKECELQGLTFLVSGAGDVEMRMPDGSILECSQIIMGAQSLVTIPWNRLTFPSMH